MQALGGEPGRTAGAAQLKAIRPGAGIEPDPGASAERRREPSLCGCAVGAYAADLGRCGVEQRETPWSVLSACGAQIGQRGQATTLGIPFIVPPEPSANAWDPSPCLSHPVGIVPIKRIPFGASGRAWGYYRGYLWGIEGGIDPPILASHGATLAPLIRQSGGSSPPSIFPIYPLFTPI